MNVRMVCLARSFKHGGLCFAGKVWNDGRWERWVRPIPDRPGHALLDKEQRCSDGKSTCLLDVVDVPIRRWCPLDHQQENAHLDTQARWQRVGQVDVAALAELVDDAPGPLWFNGKSSRQGRNDRVPAANLGGLTHSLLLLRPDHACFHVSRNAQRFELDVRVEFAHAGHEYCLKVTDTESTRVFGAKGEGRHAQDAPFLCVSLGEVFPQTGDAYKLVAGVVA